MDTVASATFPGGHNSVSARPTFRRMNLRTALSTHTAHMNFNKRCLLMSPTCYRRVSPISELSAILAAISSFSVFHQTQHLPSVFATSAFTTTLISRKAHDLLARRWHQVHVCHLWLDCRTRQWTSRGTIIQTETTQKVHSFPQGRSSCQGTSVFYQYHGWLML